MYKYFIWEKTNGDIVYDGHDANEAIKIITKCIKPRLTIYKDGIILSQNEFVIVSST